MKLSLYERIITSWRTSAIGVSGTAAALYLFNTLGCRWPSTHEWVAVILPALVGIVTKEKKA